VLSGVSGVGDERRECTPRVPLFEVFDATLRRYSAFAFPGISLERFMGVALARIPKVSRFSPLPASRLRGKKGRWRWPCALPKIEMNRAVDKVACQGHRRCARFRGAKQKSCASWDPAAAGSIRSGGVIAKGDEEGSRFI